MSSINLTPDEEALVQTARDFADRRVRTNICDWEAARAIPVEIFQEAAQAGLARIQVPKEYAGYAYSYACKMRITEELAKASMAFSFSLINTQNIAAKLGNEASKFLADTYVPRLMACELFGATALSEPNAGSDFAGIQTTAEKVDGGWRVSGEKGWITNAAFADLFITYAQTDASKGWRGIASFLIDASADGFERVAPYALMGGNAIGTGGYRLTDYFVPDTHAIHGPGEAFKLALSSINGARTYVAAMCCGMVEDALDQAVAYGKERVAFSKPVLANQGLRWLLADVATELEAARLLTYKAANLIDLGSPDAVLAASHAKKFAARMAQRCIPDCIQAMGANGLREEHRLGHQLACAKIAHYVDGSTEIQNDRIAALLFG